MELDTHRMLTAQRRLISVYRSSVAVDVTALVLLMGGCAAFFAYLLTRFHYDGLYGQDSYAYYYQARALLRELTGLAPEPWQPFTADNLYHWPVGYHLHIMAGLLLGAGPGGGRAITLAMAVGAPA